MPSTQNPIIGLDQAYFAVMTEGTDIVGGTPTYGAPVAIPGAVISKINPNGSLAVDYADNGPAFIQNTRAVIDLDLEITGISQTNLASLLGQTITNGVTGESALDTAPWVAFMFRIWVGGLDAGGNKIYKYVSLPKGKFTIPESGAETKKDSVSPQHVSLKGQFVRLEVNGLINLNGRTDENLTASDVSGWFTSPKWSLSQSLTAVTVGTITGSASAHTISIPFAKSGETFNMIVPNVKDITVSVVSTGVLIAGTNVITVGSAGIAPTLTITNSNISGVAYLVNVTPDVKDNNGVAVTPKSQLVTPA